MILPYFLRLLTLSLASFFLVHLVVSLAVSLAAPRLIEMLKGIRPHLTANWLLAVRMLPAGIALLAVAGLCVPSYLELEPDAELERVGWAGLSAALTGILILAISSVRGLRAISRSLSYSRHCELIGRPVRLTGEILPVWVTEGAAPLCALAGIFRPRLFISRRALQELSGDQLTAVLRHERGHRVARDNFKRLLVLLSPDIVPFVRGFRGLELLERNWMKHMEWAADDQAAGGNPRHALSLAEALVRAARIGSAGQPPFLVSLLIADGQDYSVRVERLLGALAPGAETSRSPLNLSGVSGVVAAALVSVLIAGGALPALLPAVHNALEALIR